MRYLIDSNWLIDYLAGDTDAVELLDRLTHEGISMSIISYMEVRHGVERSADIEQAATQLDNLTERIPLVGFSVEAAVQCAKIRDAFSRANVSWRPRSLDLMIAATAMVHELTVVTRNPSHFSDIPGISIYEHSAE